MLPLDIVLAGVGTILTVGLWTVGGITALLVVVATHRLVFHPLSRVPGPKLAALSNIWLARHVRDGRMLELGKTIHKRYGPAVRVGPNEVWFDSSEAFKSIYGVGNGFEKSDFYLATVLNHPVVDWQLNLHFADTLDLLSEFDIKRYRLQRRLVGPIYQSSNLRRFEPAVDDVMRRVISRLRALDGAEIDLKEWMHIIVVECLGAVVLSWSPGYIRDGSDGGTSSQSYLGWKRKSVFGLFPTVTTVSFFSKNLGRLFSNAWGVTFKTPKNFKPFFTAVYRKSSKRITVALKTEQPKKTSAKDVHEDLLSDLIRLHKKRPEFNELYLRRLAMTNFGAGHETMCSALTSIMAMIGCHPDVRSRVNAEVRSATTSSKIGLEDALQLPYTQACLKEAQRLHPVIGMSMSRKVPAGGLSVHGFHIPPGSTVGCNPVSLHRNPDIFGPDADSFVPERWLQGADTSALRAMERFNLTWGGGGRTCPGRHLAEMVLHKVVPALVREFDVEVVAMPDDGATPYYFMAMLTGVKARFVPAERLQRPPTSPIGINSPKAATQG